MVTVARSGPLCCATVGFSDQSLARPSRQCARRSSEARNLLPASPPWFSSSRPIRMRLPANEISRAITNVGSAADGSVPRRQVETAAQAANRQLDNAKTLERRRLKRRMTMGKVLGASDTMKASQPRRHSSIAPGCPVATACQSSVESTGPPRKAWRGTALRDRPRTPSSTRGYDGSQHLSAARQLSTYSLRLVRISATHEARLSLLSLVFLTARFCASANG